jgi:hypothetical protein
LVFWSAAANAPSNALIASFESWAVFSLSAARAG